MSINPIDAPYRPAYMRDGSTGLYYKIGGGSGGSGSGEQEVFSQAEPPSGSNSYVWVDIDGTSSGGSGGGVAYAYVGPSTDSPDPASYSQWVVNDDPQAYTLRVSDGVQWYAIAGGGGSGGGTGEPPVPSFTHTEHWSTVSVNGSASSDPDGFITNYEWVWGDGTTSEGEFLDVTTHNYAASGTYNIRLQVTDNNNNTRSTASTPITVTRMYGPVEFTTDTSATYFDPIIYLYGSESGITTEWINPTDSSLLATGLTPHITFSAGSERKIQLWTSHPDQVRTVNIGYYTGHDPGRYFPGGLPDPSHYHHIAQRIKLVTGLQSLPQLENFMAAGGRGSNFNPDHSPAGDYNPLLRGWYDGPIDYTGLASLKFIETAYNGVTDANLTGCTSLVRLCMEENRIASAPNASTLNLMPVRTNLRDLRCAFQTSVDFTTLTSPMEMLYHWCTRDETVINLPKNGPVMLPSVEELWIWNTGQTGTLIFSPLILDARIYGNSFTTLDFTNVTTKNSNGNFDASNNPITTITGLATGTRFYNLYFTNCNMSQALVNQILANVNSWNTSGGHTLGLLGNASPTGGQNNTDRLALVDRGWTVSVA